MDLGYLLDEVTITAKKKPVVRNSANPVGVDYADQVIYGKDLTNCRTMSLCLRARLRMVREPLLILVDGSEVFDLDVVNPEDVEAVEFLRRPEYMHLFRFQKDGSAPK